MCATIHTQRHSPPTTTFSLPGGSCRWLPSLHLPTYPHSAQNMCSRHTSHTDCRAVRLSGGEVVVLCCGCFIPVLLCSWCLAVGQARALLALCHTQTLVCLICAVGQQKHNCCWWCGCCCGCLVALKVRLCAGCCSAQLPSTETFVVLNDAMLKGQVFTWQ